MEVAGERVETLERLTRGELRVLLTTARALLEKTRMPRALRELRVELRKGDTHRLRELAEHLERIGFERVPMVEDVAQFSIRGGIFDVYSFGMAEPVRAEFWGDEIVDLRHFDLATQRSSRVVDFALVLPVDGSVQRRRRRVRARLDPVALSARHAPRRPARRRTSSPSSSARGTTRSITSTSRVVAARTCRARDELFESPDVARRGARVASASIVDAERPTRRRTSCFRFVRRSRSTATSSSSRASCATARRRSSSATTRARASVSTSC